MQLTGKEVRDISGPLPRIERLPADEAALMAGIKLHPEVIQAAREADLAKAKSGQSEVAAIPDVGVEVYYARRGDDYDDMVGVMFTVDMPIFQGKRQDKDHAADVSRTYEANDRLTLLMREHQAQQYQLISQYNAAKAIYDRQQSEVLPLLRKVSLVNAQYRAGSSALAELLAARRDLLSGESPATTRRKRSLMRGPPFATLFHRMLNNEAKICYYPVGLAIALAAASGYWLGSRNATTLSADGPRPKRAAKYCTGTIRWPPVPASINRENHRLWIWIWCRVTPMKGGRGGRGVQISARQQQNSAYARLMLPGGRWRRSSALSVPSRLTSAALKQFRRWPAV